MPCAFKQGSSRSAAGGHEATWRQHANASEQCMHKAEDGSTDAASNGRQNEHLNNTRRSTGHSESVYFRNYSVVRGVAATQLLVERLGVGGGGGDVSVTGSLVGAGGELEGGGSLEVVVTARGVGRGVVLLKVEVSKAGKHCCGLGC